MGNIVLVNYSGRDGLEAAKFLEFKSSNHVDVIQ
jgi:hypothetical protein